MELADVLRHQGEPRTEYYIDVPGPYGKLRLDLLGPVENALAGTPMSPEDEQAVKNVLARYEEKWARGETAGIEDDLLQAVREYPYSPTLYEALFEAYDSKGNLEEAEYYLKQLITLQPAPTHLVTLANLLGREGRYEEAALVQGHLWQTHSQVAAELAQQLAKDYLVTLSRLNDAQGMLGVAAQAISEYGAETSLVYQYFLALIIDGQVPAAKEQLDHILPQLNPNDPLYPRFLQMRDFVAQKQQ